MTTRPDDEAGTIAEDDAALERMGYSRELKRRMGGFSNFALSLSIICILSGGVTSFHLGYCSVGGAAIGLGWPLVCALALILAMTMAQVASAFPTAGGLYHWASILGGKGWGWATAWFNLAGLVTALAAVNVGTWAFARGWLDLDAGPGTSGPGWGSDLAGQAIGVGAITASQAALNHLGIRLTTRLTDLSGYLILAVAAALTASVLGFAPDVDLGRLVTFSNFSGAAGDGVWPATASLARLFALGLLLPAYTLTGYDASAHASEETVGAASAVPRGMVRSVLISGLFGWAMLSAVAATIPDPAAAASRGDRAFAWALAAVLPKGLAFALGGGIVAAMYGCGLAAVTSASRMAFAFARDGGLPWSGLLRQVRPKTGTPAAAIWAVAAAAWGFTLNTPVYATITAVCTIFLYLSYVVPVALGVPAWGRSWTRMGPWNLGGWYRPLAILAVVGSGGLVAIGMQPPNQRSAWVVGGSLAAMAAAWNLSERKRFAGPPRMDVDG